MFTERELDRTCAEVLAILPQAIEYVKFRIYNYSEFIRLKSEIVPASYSPGCD